MKALKITAGLLISALFLYLALRGIRFSEVADVLSGARVLPVILAAFIFVGAYAARTIRWQVMLRNVSSEVSFRQLLSAVFIGGAANNVLPLRAGEIIRSYAIKRFGNVSGKTAISSIVLERVLDGISLLIIMGFLMALNPFPAWVSRVGLAAVAIFGIAIILLALAFHKRRFIATKIKNEWLSRTVERFQEGLSLFSSGRNFALTMLLSLIIWGMEACVYWFVGKSLGLGLWVPAVLLCLIVVNFGLIIPSSPGFVGTFEYACVISLGVFGITQGNAMGFAILLHALFWIILVVAGFIFAWIDHGGFTRLAGAKEETI